MIEKSSLWALVALAALGLTFGAAGTAIAEPQRVPFDELPDEIKEKIREAIEKRLKERAEAANSDDSAGDSEGDQEDKKDSDAKEKKDDSADDKKKEEEPKAKPLSTKVKELREKIQQMDTEFQYEVALFKEELAEQRLKIEKLKLENQIADQLRAQEDLEIKRESSRLKLETDLLLSKAKFEKAKLDKQLTEFTSQKAVWEAKVAASSAENAFNNHVLAEDEYPEDPYKNGVLYVSDRRIELNGPIFSGAAKYVCDRIDFFNNQSKAPIFLVIDSSPGGSGMEGLQIVQAIQNSKAPIHVVVKRYAASMAAIITTLAEHSYAYPDAILLHHQASALTFGNTTAIREQLDRVNEMSARLVGEVADKLGLSEEQFVAQMYENRSTGDWDLFATEAVKRGWVGHVVDEMREASIRKRPTGSRTSVVRIGLHQAPSSESDRYEVQLTEETDEEGNPFVRLPRLSPLDAWYIYNPDQYYR